MSRQFSNNEIQIVSKCENHVHFRQAPEIRKFPLTSVRTEETASSVLDADRELCLLLVGVKTSPTTLGISMEVSQKTKNRTTT